MTLTIVMYHYVRDLSRTRYPAIKGLRVQKFEGQLDYIARHYTVVGFREVVAAIRGDSELPRNACALTFDDGFIDHYAEVFPRLVARGMMGSFYPPARPIAQRCVLDVHKLHFVLASINDSSRLMSEVLDLIGEYRNEYDLPEDAWLCEVHALPNRFDSRETVFVKRVLQQGLPQPVRADIVDRLFRRYVTGDEERFSQELYMQVDHLRQMAASGMEVGGHGDAHVSLEKLPREEQRREIEATRRFLATIEGRRPTEWFMCYPYGSYNHETIELLKESDCAVGLTTDVGIVASLDAPFELSRLDTNDLPCAADAPICEWTRRARSS